MDDQEAARPEPRAPKKKFVPAKVKQKAGRPGGQRNHDPIKITGEPWSRQQGENAKQFAAFKIYRELGPERTLYKVAEQIPCALRCVAHWSSCFRWLRRIELWEEEEDRLYNVKMGTARREMRSRHATLGQQLQRLALRALRAKVGEQYENIDELEFDARAILKYITEGAKLERIAFGDPATIEEIQTRMPTNEEQRKETPIPLTFEGRVGEALALLESAGARATDGTARSADQSGVVPA